MQNAKFGNFSRSEKYFLLKNRVECKMRNYQSKIKLNEMIFGAASDENFH